MLSAVWIKFRRSFQGAPRRRGAGCGIVRKYEKSLDNSVCSADELIAESGYYWFRWTDSQQKYVLSDNIKH
jgi:hypothetical protein